MTKAQASQEDKATDYTVPITETVKTDIIEWIRNNGLEKFGGSTIKAMSKSLHIAEGDFRVLRKMDDKFAAAIEEAISDFVSRIEPIVVKSLFNAARGYDYVQESEEIKYNKHDEIVQRIRKRKNCHQPPNISASIFLLTNLYPDRWKQKYMNSFAAVSDEDRSIQVEVVETIDTEVETKQLTSDVSHEESPEKLDNEKD